MKNNIKFIILGGVSASLLALSLGLGLGLDHKGEEPDSNPFLTSLKGTTFKKYSEYNIKNNDQSAQHKAFATFYEANKKEFIVSDVDDGDTIQGNFADEADKEKFKEYAVHGPKRNEHSIRIVGIDTPEVPGPFTTPTMWQYNWGKKASAFAKHVLFNEDDPVKIYVLPTGARAFRRVVGSVWYEKDGNVYSYAHNIIEKGLAIASRPESHTHYPLDFGVRTFADPRDLNDIEASDITERNAIELSFENLLNDTFKYASKNKKGFWTTEKTTASDKEELNENSKLVNDSGLDYLQDYTHSTNWYDVYNNKWNVLDPTRIPTDPVGTSNKVNNYLASAIERYAYAGVTWWQSDEDSISGKRAVNRTGGPYCTLDTIYPRPDNDGNIPATNPCDYIAG